MTSIFQPWDILIIGGGATGLGTAVDAASRGYSVLLLEQSDFAKGTSSRSTKLVHGGVRYLRVLANMFNGDLELTIAAYNAGENAVIRYGGIPPYEETRQYVAKVLAYYRHYRTVTAMYGAR